MHDNNALQEKLERIYNLRRTRTKVNWDAVHYHALLSALGGPHLKLPPVIHVAGTNGKGSVIAFLRAILEAQGLRVHVYTSPHLVHVNERIVLAGQEIADDALESLIDEVLSLSGDAPLSFFEIMTALAFKAFSEHPADIVLLEVGMGGRLDCTNVIEQPIATVINRISMDHTEFLGDTIEKITAEKAGIMKEGVPCIVGPQGQNEERILDVIKGAAKTIKSDAYIFGDQWFVARENGAMEFVFEGTSVEYPLPALVGGHQIQNAGVALATLRCIENHIPIGEEAIHKGLCHVRWPGRMQKLDQKSFSLSRHDEVWLDSGHNDSAGEAIATQIKAWSNVEGDHKPVYLIIGMLGTKDALSFLNPMIPYCAGVYCVPVPNEHHCHDATTIRHALQAIKTDCPILSYDNIVSAIQKVPKHPDGVRIVITGSAYLVGEALKTYKSM